MEHPVQEQAEVELGRLRLQRRMQAITIELCMAWCILHGQCFTETADEMKNYVSRVCGLTERDFEREEENGTQESTAKKVNVNDGINAILGGGSYFRQSAD